jgi:hypothetical protein
MVIGVPETYGDRRLRRFKYDCFETHSYTTMRTLYKPMFLYVSKGSFIEALSSIATQSPALLLFLH